MPDPTASTCSVLAGFEERQAAEAKRAAATRGVRQPEVLSASSAVAGKALMRLPRVSNATVVWGSSGAYVGERLESWQRAISSFTRLEDSCKRNDPSCVILDLGAEFTDVFGVLLQAQTAETLEAWPHRRPRVLCIAALPGDDAASETMPRRDGARVGEANLVDERTETKFAKFVLSTPLRTRYLLVHVVDVFGDDSVFEFNRLHVVGGTGAHLIQSAAAQEKRRAAIAAAAPPELRPLAEAATIEELAVLPRLLGVSVIRVNHGKNAQEDASELRQLKTLLDGGSTCYMPYNSRPHARACFDLGKRVVVRGLRIGAGGQCARQQLWPSSRPRVVRVLALSTPDDFGGKDEKNADSDEAAVVIGERLFDDATRDDQVHIVFPQPVEARYLQLEFVDNYGKFHLAMDSFDFVGHVPAPEEPPAAAAAPPAPAAAVPASPRSKKGKGKGKSPRG
jgi:hypothetical protein